MTTDQTRLLDVNQDETVSPLDALQVINQLNQLDPSDGILSSETDPRFEAVDLIMANDSGRESSMFGFDSEERLYVAGSYSSTTDFDTGPGMAFREPTDSRISGGKTAFITSVDRDGDFRWVQTFPGVINWEGIDVDASGNSYLTGQFFQEADLDPGPAELILNSETSATFVVSLDASGNFRWAHAFQELYPLDIAVDKNGNSFITGRVTGTTDLDPSDEVAELTPDTFDAFVLALDSSGNYRWADHFGGDGLDEGSGITADETGVYVIGKLPRTE